MDITERPEYARGARWAREYQKILAERYSSAELDTSLLRTFLFERAEEIYPRDPEDPETDLQSTAFVAGALRSLAQTMPFTPEAIAAIADAALEIGAISGAETAKIECFRALKRKPDSWWRKKAGAASPDAVVRALSVQWSRRIGRERKRKYPNSKWEVLVDLLGSREMCVLSTLETIEEQASPKYLIWSVVGEDSSFDIMARDWWEDGRLAQGAGEIVG